MNRQLKEVLAIALMLSPINCLAADVLMRVFTTPAERAAMDIQKQQKIGQSGKNSSGRNIVREVELKGIVKRSDGDDVIWLNSKNTLSSKQPEEGVRIVQVDHNGQTVKLRISGNGTVRLKPGQVFIPESGTIVDEYTVKDKR